MNEQKNRNGRGIFYGVIGVATLVVAIIGATFAYFTATASAGNEITGNMASISFGVQVQKVTKADEELGGMIPMSNTMVEAAVSGKSDSGAVSGSYTRSNICTDDNGNAVCQVYKIVVTNGGSAGMFVDGYVSLTGGSGTPTDAGSAATSATTTMRWAQAFCEGTDNQLTSCTTAGTTTTGAMAGSTGTAVMAGFSALNGQSDGTGYYNTAVKTENNYSSASLTGTGYINGNPYDIIDTNYIRISDHASGAQYQRTTDMTSALVFNQNLAAKTSNQAAFADLDSATSLSSTDAKAFYIIVWLSENGHNQTPGADPDGAEGQQPANPAAANFFSGNVTFNSAQGSEVTATFSGYTAVTSDTVTP